MPNTIIQHRYNLRSTAKRALNQPVIEEPIIKNSIFMYLLNMIAYFLDAFTPKVYKNMFKRQSEQDAINMQQEEKQEQDKEYKKDKKDEEQEQDKEYKKDEDQEQEQEQDKEDKDQENEVVEQMESLSHTNIYGLIKIIKKYNKLIDNPETRYLKQRRY